MDSINSFKGYGKVSEEEERAFRLKTRKRYTVIAVSAILLISLVIGVIVGTLIHKNKNESSSNQPSTSPVQSIKAVCSVTLYPDSCFASLSELKMTNQTTTMDPKSLFKFSMQVAVKELTKLTALPDTLIASVKDDAVKAALVDCKTLFDDAIDELNLSISSMGDFKIEDLRTMLSSAVTDQETCLDGLDETTSANTSYILSEMRSAMKNSSEFTSNSLAIVAKIFTILDDFNLPIHRKLLGTVGSDFPTWVKVNDRRLLVDEEIVKPDITVAKDGSGNFETIKEAVATIAERNKSRTVIYVKAGTYLENVVLEKKHWNVMMYGDGKTKTIVSGSLNNIDGTPTFSSATFIVAGRGFIARDMGFINTAGPEKHQAVALRSGSDQSVFYRCSFDAFQDTLYAHSNRQFYRDCDITGTVDFIFGNAAAVFQNCNIMPRQPMVNQQNTITAQGKKDPNQNSGFSIQRCTITPNGNNVTAPTYLGRPWKFFSTTVIMETVMAGLVHPDGWLPWVPNTIPPSTIYYAEYQNTGPGAPLAKRVTWPGYKPTITAAEAGKFSVASLIQGGEWLPTANVKFD
ncbi:hypothetical protein GIB67_009712 [Kingdonia uniflora]|uniref:Pectinesterase n=1 Tax=Kingdonia uniflora TaxID=39325 RepID=A0A7J7LB58_9MAGN|nr:hypothetical protein GIB67_009712 [Kingdonia uniflora]